MNHSMGPALEPDDGSRRTQAIEEYCSSDTFIVDAIQWIVDARELPAELVNSIQLVYLHSSAFDTVIDDHLDGEVKWT